MNYVQEAIMEKHKQLKTDHSALEHDVIETLAQAPVPISISADLKTRMKLDVMQKIKQEKACENSEFSTSRDNEGEWIEVMPGAQFKVLHDDGNGLDGVLSYLIKLDAGIKLAGHSHPFDEECLMLEGDLTLGDLTLNKGDFHFATAGVRHDSVSTQNGCTAFIRGALPV